MHRFLALSPQYEPLINGAVAFVSVLLILLSYYRLGGAGALLGCVLSAAVWFAFRVAATFIFVFAVVGGSAIVQESTFCQFPLAAKCGHICHTHESIKTERTSVNPNGVGVRQQDLSRPFGLYFCEQQPGGTQVRNRPSGLHLFR
jgi:hypothetical protein